MAAREDAQTALYKAAKDAADRVEKASGTVAAQLLVAAATAFRAAEGGQQIGAVHLDAK